MRCTLFALFLSAGTLALGQAGPASPLTPFVQEPLIPFGQAPSLWSTLNHNFGRMTPQQWEGLQGLHSWTVLLPPPKTVAPLGDASMDARMIRRPSGQNLGMQPPGTQVAQNLFPGLKFQPIDDPLCPQQPGASQAEPLSTTWPKLEVKRIPTDWPTLRMEPVGELGEAAPATGPHP